MNRKRRAFWLVCLGVAVLAWPSTSISPSVSGAGDESLSKGTVIERVVCRSDATQSYALFLPSNYSPDKKWPILYAFDPGARGAMPVELFKEAAEKYGYIVVGSNNSHNGIEVGGIVETLWAETHARFSIDERRTYTTGLSGGARVACAVGLRYEGQVAGVIACSAGFPSTIKPSASLPFVFYGTTGRDDFNFPELRQLDRALASLGITHHVAVFDGGHQWLPRELCGEALEWMEMQAMRDGRRAKNETLIDDLFKRRLDRARMAGAAHKEYEAFVNYDALIAEFKGLRETSEYEKRLQELKNSKDVKDVLKAEKSEEERQIHLGGQLDTLARQLNDPANAFNALGEFKTMIADLRRKSEGQTDTSERRVARRVLQQTLVQASQEIAAYREQKNFAAVATRLEIMAQVKPASAQIFYDLAVAYALNGKKKRALEALKRAVENGFTDAAKIEQDQNLAPLREEAEFQKLVVGLKKGS